MEFIRMTIDNIVYRLKDDVWIEVETDKVVDNRLASILNELMDNETRWMFY